MFSKKLIPFAIASIISPLALADDCGESVYLGEKYIKTIYTHLCTYTRPGYESYTYSFTSTSSTGGLCPAPASGYSVNKSISNSEAIYESEYDNAPIAGYRIRTGQSADGYGWTRVTPNASDDNGIDNMLWIVDGVEQNTSSLYYRNAKPRPLSHSVTFKVTDNIGQECSANFNITVASPTCGTRESNQGCN